MEHVAGLRSASYEIEHQVTEIWKQMLGVDTIRRDDLFIDLNGDSLAATLIALKLGEVFAIEITPGEIYANPTVEHLSLLVATRRCAISGRVVEN